MSFQVKSGKLFDNVLITNDLEYAKQLTEETWGKHKDVSSSIVFLFLINSSSYFIRKLSGLTSWRYDLID